MNKYNIYMAASNILTFPSDVLAKSTSTIKDAEQVGSNEQILQLIQDMKNTMYEQNGIGLAANQIGYTSSIFVIDVDGNGAKTFINPSITDLRGQTNIQEGCLSIPGAFVWNSRYSEVDVQYIDEYGESHFDTFTGREAVAIQHEMDHLNGMLFIDHFGPVKRNLALNKHEKFLKNKKK